MNLIRQILFFLLISTGTISAQTDFRPGYIINVAGDSLYGKIDYRGDILMSNVCKFKDANNTIMEYTPNDLIAYRFVDNKYYVSREINGTNVFLEYLINGEVSIYYFRDENGDHYYLDKEDVKLTEIPYEKGIKYIDDKRLYFETTKHKRLLYYFMQDAPGFQSKTQSIKKPDHISLIKLAEDYHNAVCEGESCIIYEKKQPFLKVNLEAVTGVISFQNIEGVNERYNFQGGIIAHFWLPRTNEKLYFKTGVLYSDVEHDVVNNYSIKIPIHIGYMAPNSFRIRPSISIGLLTPSYNCGIAIRISEKINLGVQSMVNFFSNEGFFPIPSKLFNYSILGSLLIEL